MTFLFISLLILSVATFASAKLTIAVVSDVHIDPYYDPYVIMEDKCHVGGRKDSTFAPYGRRQCDSPYSLFSSTISKLKETTPNINFILNPGDFVSHFIPLNPGKEFDERTYQRVKTVISSYAKEMVNKFPNVPMAFTLGNNDYLYHYQVPDVKHKSDFYGFLYDLWIHSIKANKFAVLL